MCRGFSREFDSCMHELVNSTLELHKQSIDYLLPTPTKSHYLFNLRDFSKVIQVRVIWIYILTLS